MQEIVCHKMYCQKVRWSTVGSEGLLSWTQEDCMAGPAHKSHMMGIPEAKNNIGYFKGVAHKHENC